MDGRTMVTIATTALLGLAAVAPTDPNTGPELNDLEMAHVAVTANNTDIAYAHLALALSENPKCASSRKR